jgi:hypothetical protein
VPYRGVWEKDLVPAKSRFALWRLCRPIGLVLCEHRAKVRPLASPLQTATGGKARRADGGVDA